MNWKTSLQLRDLSADQRLEMTCKQCGHIHYMSVETIAEVRGSPNLYLDEIERMTTCKSYGCWGRVRLALVRRGDTSGFVGGLA